MRLTRVVRPKLPRLTLGCAKISGLRPTVNGETPRRRNKPADRAASARRDGRSRLKPLRRNYKEARPEHNKSVILPSREVA